MLFNLILILFGIFVAVFWFRFEWIVKYWTRHNESDEVQEKIIRETKQDKNFNTIRVIVLIMYLFLLIPHLSRQYL